MMPAIRTQDRTIAVNVWLFGELSRLSAAKPLRLPVAEGATIKVVLDKLADATSPTLAEIVLNSDGTRKRLCKLFLNGELVELEDQLPRGRDPIDLELIILTAAEGG